MAPIPEATTTEKLLILPQLLYSVSAGFLRYLTYPLISGSKAQPAFKDAFYAFLRTNLGMLSVAQEQMLMTSTGAAYSKFIKTHGVQAETTTLPSGLKLHWFGEKAAEKTIFYLHGGGYVMAASDGHLKWLADLQKDLATKASINIVLVEYSLAPKGQYPTQLKEAAEALQWLLNDHGKTPNEVILAGDSAGGNLALALIYHILHPHPEVPTKITLSEPFLGAILISPWTHFGSEFDSITRNAQSDLVGPATGGRWSSLFMGNAALDRYNQPYTAEADWIRGIDKVVKDIFVWGGGGELMIDAIDGMANKLKEVHPNVQLVIEPGAGHEDFIIELLIGYKRKAQGTKVIESWISSRL